MADISRPFMADSPSVHGYSRPHIGHERFLKSVVNTLLAQGTGLSISARAI
jgi:hypothetical protein